MNVVDFVRGLGTIFFIMCVAGAVAYVGDRVGHQVGRRRLTLFNIRPRYTSTIVAVGTGMIIALVVITAAIIANQQVKTAFFHLNAINQEITALQAKEQQLNAKITTGRLAVLPGTSMVPFGEIIKQSFTADQREAAVKAFAAKSIEYMNANAQFYGLKKFKPPADFDKQLTDFSNATKMQALLAQGNVVLTIAADQNLFVNDPIHFEIIPTSDILVFPKGQPIAEIKIPGNSGANVNQAVTELQQLVAANAVRRVPMPDYLADHINIVQSVPSASDMQNLFKQPGTYYLIAYAAEDVYPHTSPYNIQITLGLQSIPNK